MDPKNRQLVSVGIFFLTGLACLGYLSFTLGNMHPLGTSDYPVHAEFVDVGGLKVGGDVTVAGVSIGKVQNIRLKNDQALVTLSIHRGIELKKDSVAIIKTMGLIGDEYVSITQGTSSAYIERGGWVHKTKPPFDLEQSLGDAVFGKLK